MKLKKFTATKIQHIFQGQLESLRYHEELSQELSLNQIKQQLQKFYVNQKKHRSKQINNAIAQIIKELNEIDTIERMMKFLQKQQKLVAKDKNQIINTSHGPVVYDNDHWLKLSLANTAAILFLNKASGRNKDIRYADFIYGYKSCPEFYQRAVDKIESKLLKEKYFAASKKEQQSRLVKFFKKHKRTSNFEKERFMKEIIDRLESETELDFLIEFFQEKQKQIKNFINLIVLNTYRGPVVISNKPLYKLSIYINTAIQYLQYAVNIKQSDRLESIVSNSQDNHAPKTEKSNFFRKNVGIHTNRRTGIQHKIMSKFKKKKSKTSEQQQKMEPQKVETDLELIIQNLELFSTLLQKKCLFSNSAGIRKIQNKLNEYFEANLEGDEKNDQAMQCALDICYLAKNRLDRRMSRFHFTSIMPGRHPNIERLYQEIQAYKKLDYSILEPLEKEIKQKDVLAKLRGANYLLQSKVSFTFHSDKKLPKRYLNRNSPA